MRFNLNKKNCDSMELSILNLQHMILVLEPLHYRQL